MKVSAKVQDKLLENVVPLAFAGIAFIVIVGYALKKIGSAAADKAGDLLTGNTDYNAGTDFAGKGLFGTFGGATNILLGGLPQAVGEKVSSWFTPKLSAEASNNLYYKTLFPDGKYHSLPANTVDKDGFTSWQGVRYRIGYNQAGQRIAVRV